jgi:hypothetical protein
MSLRLIGGLGQYHLLPKKIGNFSWKLELIYRKITPAPFCVSKKGPFVNKNLVKNLVKSCDVEWHPRYSEQSNIQ